MCSDNETTQDFIAKGTEVIQVSEVTKGTVDFRPVGIGCIHPAYRMLSQ